MKMWSTVEILSQYGNGIQEVECDYRRGNRRGAGLIGGASALTAVLCFFA